MNAHGGWLPLLVHCLQQHASVVRVVIAKVRGSAPREIGATMIVTATGVHGTIGGGRLEWEVLRNARALLDAGAQPAVLRNFVLGVQLGQCCGGVVDVWLERHTQDDLELLTAAQRRSQSGPVELRATLQKSNTVQRFMQLPSSNQFANAACASLQHSANGDITLVERLDRPLPLWLYGAGHVGQAVLRIVAELPWQVTWIDSRAEFLSAETGLSAPNAGHARRLCSAEPATTVQQAPAGCSFLVMTHSHALDYALVRTILGREFAWAGLIGSNSKSARFRAQLRRDGVPAAQVERLVCPIGIAGLHDKHPTAIAVSVVAQLLQHFQPATALPVSTPQQVAEPCAQSCSHCGVSVVPS